MNASAVLVAAALVVAGCAASGTAEPSHEGGRGSRSSTGTDAASSTTIGSDSDATSTVRTSGGDVTVEARAGRLELVDVAAASGWVGDHRLDGPTRLVVSFERKGSRVDVTIDLTPSGITTASRSVSTG